MTYVLLGCVPALMFHTVPFATRMIDHPFFKRVNFLIGSSKAVDLTLDDVEVRVLGALIEKEITTPDYYPLSLNSLVAACNQSSNRHPVVHFDEGTVIQATDTLREKQLVHLDRPRGIASEQVPPCVVRIDEPGPAGDCGALRVVAPRSTDGGGDSDPQ